MFKKSFKYYKAKLNNNFDDVISFDINGKEFGNDAVSEFELKYSPHCACCTPPLGLKPISDWKCYELNKSGLLIIKNPFTAQGQRYWIARCLRDYPKTPNHVSLTPKLYGKNIRDNWWSSVQNCTDKFQKIKLKSAMRWTTLGYHHDWDTKVYSEERQHQFPVDLKSFSHFLAILIGYDNYSAEAAIVNYYPIGTTLAGHQDHSENNLEAPLFSLSFGQSAIFLIGGETIEEKPFALYLKSGDIAVMSKQSRLSFHAVPRVFKDVHEPWNNDKGIINQRTQDKNSQISKDITKCCADKMLHFDENLWHNCNTDNYTFWKEFDEYLNDSRININVRQVLKTGQTSLYL